MRASCRVSWWSRYQLKGGVRVYLQKCCRLSLWARACAHFLWVVLTKYSPILETMLGLSSKAWFAPTVRGLLTYVWPHTGAAYSVFLGLISFFSAKTIIGLNPKGRSEFSTSIPLTTGIVNELITTGPVDEGKEWSVFESRILKMATCLTCCCCCCCCTLSSYLLFVFSS